MSRLLLSIAGLSIACVMAAPTLAQAQNGHRRFIRTETAPPLTVTKRSWLDSGNVVAVGTQDTYLSASTTLNAPVYASFLPARFGQSTLPGQFDLPLPGNPRGPDTGGIFFGE